MQILVVGGGGREHAICRALAKSARVTKLYCAPGNGGISQVAECVPIAATDIGALVRFAVEKSLGLVMVASDDPLALGLVNELEAAGIRAFGPRREAAVIESSKAFSKSLMKKYNIPTARYETFTDLEAALRYVRAEGAPIVVKADGLALGKGVTVARTVAEAETALREMMEGAKFGASGATVVIEECMEGREATFLAFTDGGTVVTMPTAQDHKRAFDGDLGPNTGGMGAVCPNPQYSPELEELCMRTIFRPTIDAMNAEGRRFRGVIYFELMLTPAGPRVIEYNARFGDPEAQAILPLLKTDLLDVFDAVIDGRLADIAIEWEDGASCCVVMASGGYPGDYEKGREIFGLPDVPDDIIVFHAGTKRGGGAYFTNGGRVLGVTATGTDLPSAIAKAYAGVSRITWDGVHFRRDIGGRAADNRNK
ncbi:MAG: phosphoribosylamine--glycine ligase [Oscillospiraceae bacterium]|jgi:phosphoribosylamine--glycine ligase|nr:phosphoribosylamine--glycine ligase [Oscillospiraceae bacterium]